MPCTSVLPEVSQQSTVIQRLRTHLLDGGSPEPKGFYSFHLHVCEHVCTKWPTETLKTLSAIGSRCVRQEPMPCLHTEMCRLTQDRGLSGGNPVGGERGQETLPALPCPLFPLSDVSPPPNAYTAHSPPSWHMGTINHCCDLAERPRLTQHSSSAIKTLFMILCLLLTDPEIL